MQSFKQNSELRKSKIMWQDIGAVIWTLSSCHETFINGQLFILPRRQYEATNIASVIQINIAKLINKLKKKNACTCRQLADNKKYNSIRKANNYQIIWQSLNSCSQEIICTSQRYQQRLIFGKYLLSFGSEYFVLKCMNL